MQLTEKEKLARKHLCVALDVENHYRAINLAEKVHDLCYYLKVSGSMYIEATREGVRLIGTLWDIMGEDRPSIISDVKIHDTPQKAYNTARALSSGGEVAMFTVHIENEEMCREAIRGAEDGVKNLRKVGNDGFYIPKRPRIIGVTELTSLDDKDLRIKGSEFNYCDSVLRKAELAREWSLDGVVSSIDMAGELETRFGPDFIKLIPGMIWKGKGGGGQKHTYSPEQGVMVCKNSILIGGRAITESENIRETTYQIVQAMAKEL